MKTEDYHEKRKKEIIFLCCCSTGLGSVSVKKLAERCGMSPSNLYTYFENNDDFRSTQSACRKGESV